MQVIQPARLRPRGVMPTRASKPVSSNTSPIATFGADRLSLNASRAAEPYPPLLRPMPGVITQGVSEQHPAIDIACTEGTPVRAAHDGEGHANYIYTHGLTMELRRADGLITTYSHLSKAQPAGTFKRGDLVGACGNTGAWTTGPHLHFGSNHTELLNHLSDT